MTQPGKREVLRAVIARRPVLDDLYLVIAKYPKGAKYAGYWTPVPAAAAGDPMRLRAMIRAAAQGDAWWQR